MKSVWINNERWKLSENTNNAFLQSSCICVSVLVGIKMVILVSVECTESSVEKSSITFCSLSLCVCLSMLAGIKMVIPVSVESTEISVEKSSVTFCSLSVSVCACRNQNGDSSVCRTHINFCWKIISNFLQSFCLCVSIYACRNQNGDSSFCRTHRNLCWKILSNFLQFSCLCVCVYLCLQESKWWF